MWYMFYCKGLHIQVMEMRIKLTLVNDQKSYTVLPVSYNHLIQSAIYNSLSDDFAEFLHEKGFRLDNSERKFALFTFSNLHGKSEYLRETKNLLLLNPVELYISSPIEKFISDILQTFLQNGIRLGKEQLRIEQMQLDHTNVTSEKIIVKTLSPITAYSTMIKPEGTKYTVYFHPGQVDFERLLLGNLEKKVRLIYGQDVQLDPTHIQNIGKCYRKIITYKKTIIEAYEGIFALNGDRRMLQAALDCGIGPKSSAGLGMVTICSPSEKE